MKAFNKKWVALSSVVFSMGLLTQAFASSHSSGVKAQLQGMVPQIQSWSNGTDILTAVNAANTAHAGLTKAEIRKSGAEWHQGVIGKSSVLFDEVNQSALTAQLKTIQSNSQGLYTGIIVTDKKGLVVGQTVPADHYSLASQGFWKKINKDGVNAVYYGKASKKEAQDQAKIGLPIVSQNEVVGAVLVNVKAGGVSAK